MQNNIDVITLGAGCFWCVEAVFQDLKGVIKVESGYCNGNNPSKPSYKEVCTGLSGYVEVLQVTFDKQVISLQTVLDVFWHTHDPTTLNRQGNDRGTQYRSGIYCSSQEQRDIALKSKQRIEQEGVYDNPIVTEIEDLENYFPAEDYHQEYYNRVGSQNPYCSFVITPKVAKFRKQYASLLKIK